MVWPQSILDVSSTRCFIQVWSLAQFSFASFFATNDVLESSEETPDGSVALKATYEEVSERFG